MLFCGTQTFVDEMIFSVSVDNFAEEESCGVALLDGISGESCAQP